LKSHQKLKGIKYEEKEQLKPKEELAEKISFCTCGLIALHPFFELNGRRILSHSIFTLSKYNITKCPNA